MDEQTLTMLCFDKVARADLLVFLQYMLRRLAIGLERPDNAVGASDRLRDGITIGLVPGLIFSSSRPLINSLLAREPKSKSILKSASRA